MKRRTFIKNLSAAAFASQTILKNHLLAAQNESGYFDPSFFGKKRVAIFGGGVAGLTSAHELLERGFDVTVYELKDIPGGKARSMDVPHTGTGGRKNLPGEHGFRYFPGFYKNIPDTLSRIPFGIKTVLDNLVTSKKIHFSRSRMDDLIIPAHPPKSLFELEEYFRLIFKDHLGIHFDDIAFFAKRMRAFLTSCNERRFQEFEHVSWWDFIGAENRSDAYQKVLALGTTRTLVAMKAEHASTRTIGRVLIQLSFNLAGIGGSIDRLLNAPTNEAWINPWMDYLKNLGLKHQLNTRLQKLHFNSKNEIEGATVEHEGDRQTVEADFYICAVPMEIMRDHILDDVALKSDPDLMKMRTLKAEWMTGIQFFFDQDILLPHGHTLYLDSPWAITSVSQAQFWKGKTDLSKYGDGNCKGVLSIDISDWTKPGIFIKKTAQECTREEIKEEIFAQLKDSLDSHIWNQIQNARLLSWHLDPAIKFDSRGITLSNDEPLLINNTGSWDKRPQATTKIPNLFLASDYVQTDTDVACMESANEAARRAVNAILKKSGNTSHLCKIFTLNEPAFLNYEKMIDLERFRQGLKNRNDI